MRYTDWTPTTELQYVVYRSTTNEPTLQQRWQRGVQRRDNPDEGPLIVDDYQHQWRDVPLVLIDLPPQDSKTVCETSNATWMLAHGRERYIVIWNGPPPRDWQYVDKPEWLKLTPAELSIAIMEWEVAFLISKAIL